MTAPQTTHAAVLTDRADTFDRVPFPTGGVVRLTARASLRLPTGHRPSQHRTQDGRPYTFQVSSVDVEFETDSTDGLWHLHHVALRGRSTWDATDGSAVFGAGPDGQHWWRQRGGQGLDLEPWRDVLMHLAGSVGLEFAWPAAGGDQR